ncbi:phosphatidylglycerol lysyltransferase domain-containing protein, partial [Desulfobacterales bacterium HSG17]|nr:phosphatidylglycerol lysyltransferase domain-containing protein [Desulfobacterales bacterium HSG17]
MSFVFHAITSIDKNPYQSCFEQTPQKTSDYAFTNLWAWAESHKLEWAMDGNLCWIRQIHPQKVYWAPVGSWYNVDWEKAFFKITSRPLNFIRIPEELIGIWSPIFKDRLKITETRGDWDYIYSFEDLLHLSGNRFHKKKNLVNQFKKKYSFIYHPFDETLVEQALKMQETWCVWRDCESNDILSAENKVIEKILSNWATMKELIGGALLVDGEMAAYTIAEAMRPDTLVIHIEKGNPEFKGVYQAIQQVFLENFEEKYQ